MEAEPPEGIGPGAVALVARHRMSDAGELHSDLVPPPRLELEREEAVALALGHQPPTRHGALGATLARLGPAHAARSLLDEPGVEDTAGAVHMPLHQGGVATLRDELVPLSH